MMLTKLFLIYAPSSSSFRIWVSAWVT